MTIINRLSDRDGFIYDAIAILLVNIGYMDLKRLQFELLKCGVYVKKTLLQEAVKTMNEKGLITKPPVVQAPAKPKIIVP